MATHKDPNSTPVDKYYVFDGSVEDNESFMKHIAELKSGDDEEEWNPFDNNLIAAAETKEEALATAESTVYNEGEFDIGYVYRASFIGMDSNWGEYATFKDENGKTADEFTRWFSEVSRKEWEEQEEDS